MMCWVERGVRNHREVVIEWVRWGRGCLALNFVNRAPPAAPNKRARSGPLAARGLIGASEIGGMTSQLSAAPQEIAARERIEVGAVNKILELFKLRRGGCWFMPSWLIIVPRMVYVAVRVVAAKNKIEIIMFVGAVFDSSRIGSFE